MSGLNLLPAPRHLEMTEGTFALTDGRLVLLDSPNPPSLRFAAARFEQALHDRLGLKWHIVASKAVPQDPIALTLRVTPDETHSEGYELIITPDGITIEARDDVGIFYGICTLIQLLDSCASSSALDALHITDWPDFPARGVMLDVSRDKIPTMGTLFTLVDMLAGWKINQLQLYIEHTFAYRHHPEVWANASPFTGQEMLDLDAYCRERHIELVPNQNSFGHMERWLKLPRYLPLAEIDHDFDVPWGKHAGPFSLCPIDPGSLELVRGLFDELLPHFTSRMFNVGCDETFDVGQGRSKDECAARGSGRVYLDFLLKVYREVKARDHTMQFWGDIIVQHPELIPELPKDSIALEWGYEANHPFDEHGAQFSASGIPFYVCPGTSSWCSLAGRTDNAIGNLLSAAKNGLKHGATGYLNTDWGDYGHWQVVPVSYLGFVAGAAYSWALEANRNLDIPHVLSLYAFRDPTGSMGRVAYDLGNVYRVIGPEPHNASVLFRVLQWPLDKVHTLYKDLSGTAFYHAIDTIDQAMLPLSDAQIARPDAGLIMQEFILTARLLRHACRRALLALEEDPAQAAQLRRELDRDMQELIPQYRKVWLSRNRPGGLADSVARFETIRKNYE
jgi:hypothetical protein